MSDVARSAGPAWTPKRDTAVEPADIADAIGIGRTMTLHDLCTALGVSGCAQSYDKIRKTVPQANSGHNLHQWRACLSVAHRER
jgi:hypothetical protein